MSQQAVYLKKTQKGDLEVLRVAICCIMQQSKSYVSTDKLVPAKFEILYQPVMHFKLMTQIDVNDAT